MKRYSQVVSFLSIIRRGRGRGKGGCRGRVVSSQTGRGKILRRSFPLSLPAHRDGLHPLSSRFAGRSRREYLRVPLPPAALAVTAGIVLDRFACVPLLVSLAAALAAGVAWGVALSSRKRGLPLVYLALVGVAAGAAWHHYRRDVFRPDDIGNDAPAEARPAALRGVLDEEPVHARRRWCMTRCALRDRPESATALLRVTALRQRDDWLPASGRLRLTGVPLDDLHAGDPVEVVGRLARLAGPANPGEYDLADHWAERGIRAQLIVRPAPGAVTRLERGWPDSFGGWLAVVRGWGQQVMERWLPNETAGLARPCCSATAAPLAGVDWEKYLRTGVSTSWPSPGNISSSWRRSPGGCCGGWACASAHGGPARRPAAARLRPADRRPAAGPALGRHGLRRLRRPGPAPAHACRPTPSPWPGWSSPCSTPATCSPPAASSRSWPWRCCIGAARRLLRAPSTIRCDS